MNNTMDHFVNGCTTIVSRYHWLVLLAVTALVGIFASGLGNLGFNDNYRVYFSPQNPDLLAWEDLLDTYSRTDNLIVVVERTDGKKIFSPDAFPLVISLTERLWQVPYVTRVDSVSNFQNLSADGNDLVVKDLVPADKSEDSTFLRDQEAFANTDPEIGNLMVSSDGSATALYLELMIPEQGNAIENVTEYIRHLRQEIEETQAGVRPRFGGMVMLNSAVDEVSREDVGTILPIMVFVIVVMMWLTLRSIPALLTTLLTVILVTVATMGLAGHLGIRLSPHSSIAPQVMLTVAIATAIHMMVGFLRYLNETGDRVEAVRSTLRQNLFPVGLTCLTTGIGFLSMLLSDVPPFQHIGIICGSGMALCFIISVFFLPALLVAIPFSPGLHAHTTNARLGWSERLGHFVLNNRLKILSLALLGIIPVGIGISHLEISDHPVRLFSEGTYFRDDADFIDANFAGTTDIQFSVKAGLPGGINTPEFLHRLEKFKQRLIADPLVNHVKVLSDSMKRINKSMHGNDPEYYRIPRERDMAAQYLLFYEMNLPFGMELNNQIDVDRSSVRVIVTVRSSSSREITAFLDRIHAWIDKEMPETQARGVSVLVMFAYLADRAAQSMFLTAFVATFSIAIILVLSFKSWRLGLLSLLPNLLPMFYVFGIWSLLGRTVDIAASLIFSMTLGVVVDDTVHFMNKFSQATRRSGMDAYNALIEAYKGVAPAMVYSTVILALGFLVFLVSGIQTNATLGLLTAMTFVVALLLDLLVLPVLIYYAQQKVMYTSVVKAPVTAVEG